MSEHTSQLKNSNDYVPYLARNIFINATWNENNRLTNLQNEIQGSSNLYEYKYGYSHKRDPFKKETLHKMHPISKALYKKFKVLSEDKQINQLFDSREKLTKKYYQNLNQFRKNKPVYEIELLEKIAKRKGIPVKITEIENIAKKYSKRINTLYTQIEQLDSTVNQHPLIKDLWEFISKDNEKTIKKKLQIFDFWYPIKVIFWQALFLIPLFILFYIWHIKSISKEKRLYVLISAHLLVITSIPLLFRIIDILIEILPNHIFRELIGVLKSLHLVAIWHYILITFSIIFSIVIISFLQKKIFNKDKIIRERLRRSDCIKCGNRVLNNSKFCIYCGENQFEKCNTCEMDTYIGTIYCMHCGTKH